MRHPILLLLSFQLGCHYLADRCPPEEVVGSVRDSTWPTMSGTTGAFTFTRAERPACGPHEELDASFELIGPSGAPVGVSVVDRRSERNPALSEQSVEVDSTYPATEPGNYRVIATMEPDGRVHEQLLSVARPRPEPLPEVARLPAPPAGYLYGLQETARGTAIYDLSVYRDGEVVQTLPSGTVLVSGNTVWTISSSQVARFIDDGSGPLVQSPPFALEPSLPGSLHSYRIAASDADAIADVDGTLVRFRATDFEILQDGEVALTDVSPDELIVSGTTAVVSGAREGSPVVCHVHLPPSGGLELAGVCEPFEPLSKRDSQTLWHHRRGQVDLLGIEGARLTLIASVGASVYDPNLGGPRGVYARLESHGLIFEETVLPAPFTIERQTPLHVIGKHPDAEDYRLFRR